MTFQEEKLQFDFSDEAWEGVLQFDKTPFYPKASNAIEGTKGIDFVGIWKNHSLVLIEVKDFRKHRIETKPRVEGKDDPLWLEIARKMKNSISIIVGGGRVSNTDQDAWKSYLTTLSLEKKNLQLVLWLEQDLPPNTDKSRRNRELHDRYLLRKLKNSLEWLTTKIEIADIRNNPFRTALTVSFL